MDPTPTDPTVALLLKILDVAIEAEPLVESAIESWLTGRKAKRVEEIRPADGTRVEAEIERLKKGE